jgi:hypothetical protein
METETYNVKQNFEELVSRLGGNRGLAYLLVKSFLEIYPSARQKLQQSFSLHDTTELAKNAHYVRGMLLEVGCENLAKKLLFSTAPNTVKEVSIFDNFNLILGHLDSFTDELQVFLNSCDELGKMC